MYKTCRVCRTMYLGAEKCPTCQDNLKRKFERIPTNESRLLYVMKALNGFEYVGVNDKSEPQWLGIMRWKFRLECAVLSLKGYRQNGYVMHIDMAKQNQSDSGGRDGNSSNTDCVNPIGVETRV